jgi:hypothetical protein
MACTNGINTLPRCKELPLSFCIQRCLSLRTTTMPVQPFFSSPRTIFRKSHVRIEKRRRNSEQSPQSVSESCIHSLPSVPLSPPTLPRTECHLQFRGSKTWIRSSNLTLHVDPTIESALLDHRDSMATNQSIRHQSDVAFRHDVQRETGETLTFMPIAGASCVSSAGSQSRTSIRYL